MRVVGNQYSAIMSDTLRFAHLKLAHIMQQIASGNRILRPSDDAIATVKLGLLDREAQMLKQYRHNIGVLSDRLRKNEVYLDGIVEDVMSARDLLLSAADGSNTRSNLIAIASPLRILKDSLFQVANTKDGDGHYLFSGTLTDSQTITYDPDASIGSRYTFTGNTEQQNVVVGNGMTQVGNLSLDEMAALLNRLDATVAALQSPDSNTQKTVSGCLDAVDTGMNSFTDKIAILGGAQNTLSLLDENYASLLVANEQAVSEFNGLDYGEAFTEMNGYLTAIQSTQKVYSRVIQLSLFDVL